MSSEKLMPPVHPGELLAEILDDANLSAYALAKAIGKAPIQVSRILSGKAGITADMARLIGQALGTSAELWMNFQARYDLDVSRDKKPTLNVPRILDEEIRI